MEVHNGAHSHAGDEQQPGRHSQHDTGLQIIAWVDSVLAEIGETEWAQKRKKYVRQRAEGSHRRKNGPKTGTSPDSFLTRLRHAETVETAPSRTPLSLSQVPDRLLEQDQGATEEHPQMAHRICEERSREQSLSLFPASNR